MLYHGQLENYARKRFKKDTIYEPLFKEFKPTQQLENYLSGHFMQPRPVRPRSLILVGRSRLGKTEWARSLGPHVYIQGQYSLDAFNVKNYQYIVWDDVPWDRIPAKKQFLGCQRHPFFLSDKYRGKQSIALNGAISIVCCNDDPLQLESDSWYQHNTITVTVLNKLY